MFEKIKDKINTIKEDNKKYTELLNNSIALTDLTPLPNLEQIPIKKNVADIINSCPDLNKEKAIIISKVIPTEETYLDILYIKAIKTNTDYWLIPTNKKIWICNEKTYGIIIYENITICNIVKNNIMSKIINLDNIIFEINGNDNKINNLISLINNQTYRTNIINEKTKYLNNIIPSYQLINEINSGISIDNNNTIVFHSEKNNYKLTPDEILNYEILSDNNSIITKNQARNTSINSFQNGCYSLSLRITTKDNSFTIPILEQNSLGKKYGNNDNIFIENMNFAKQIIEKLNEICNIKY